jgi:hypothetical protein
MKNPNLDLEKSIWNLEKISSPSWNLEKRLEKIKKNFWFQKKSLLLEVGAEPRSTCTLSLHWLHDERGATLQVSLPVNHSGGQQHSALSRPYQL